MSEEKLKKLQEVRRVLKTLSEQEKELAVELGEAAPPPTPTAQMVAERSDADLFDHLTPAELTHLYRTDREQWQRIMRAKGQDGVRKLLHK